MNFETFLIVITILYIFQIGIFLMGLKLNRDPRSGNLDYFVSVIIAARNEEASLQSCLESVVSQTYPTSKYEIIIVDDASTDNTKNVCELFVKSHSNIKIITAHDDPNTFGKANALACGIENARGEIILITDADCTVPVTWIEETAMRYNDKTGLVGGCTIQKASTPFEGMQSLDWIFILGMAASAAGLRYPLGSIGNNLSFRKSAYDETGGYRKLKFSVTEDYTVVQAIAGSGKWIYQYPLDPKHLVESKPCPDFLTLIRQKQRWGKGGLDMRIPGFAIMIIGFLMHLSPFIMLLWGNVILVATAFMMKFTADYIFLYQILKKLNRTGELRWFYWFELYFIVYVILLPFLVFFGGNVKWKGREF